jgi:nuclear GTP-binding protein
LILYQLNDLIIGNTRVITQNALQKFQDEMDKVKNDPYKLIIKPTNLPTKILNESSKVRLKMFINYYDMNF